jgi:hypothetical protein
MAFAIVHFTVGFVSVLAFLWLLPITRYRLTGAFLGGIWGLVPDAHKILDGSRGAWFAGLHDSSDADIFFFHSTLDEPFFRAQNIEITFLSLAALGVAFLLYDWRFGRRAPTVKLFGSSTEPPTSDSD